jgi:hypothetical protein
MNAKWWRSVLPAGLALLAGLSLLAAMGLLAACRPPEEEPPEEEVTPSDVVALGDSITMGIQDAGLVESYQLHCYPYFVAKQMGQAAGFQQPLVSSPGIGVPPYATPLQLSGGQITADPLPEGITEAELITMIFGRLENVRYADPYNNLGVNGARLHDLRFTTGYDHTYYDIANFFYDIVLRNQDLPLVPNFGGLTMVEEAALLEPKYILLWIGNNDALGYVLGGGEDIGKLADPTAFETEYRLLLDDLLAGTPAAKIVLATIPEYLPFGYALDGIFVSGVPKLFDPVSFQPIDFDEVTEGVQSIDLYLDPTETGTIAHLLLTGAAAYLEAGVGVPQLPDPDEDAAMVAKLTELGIPAPASGERLPMAKEFLFTSEEETNTLDRIQDFNDIIWLLAGAAEYDLPVVDACAFMQPGGGWDASAYQFALAAQEYTAWSLDGIHPNDYGHALIANEFIETMNLAFGLSIPPLDPDSYRGQYAGLSILPSALKAMRGLRDMYLPRR